MVVSFKRSSSNNVHTNASLKTTNFTVLELNSNLTAYIKNEDMAATTTATTTKQDIAAFPAQTVATFVINNKRPTIIIYPTVSPESVVIPIVSCILGFPLLALLVICCLRRRAKLARERDRRRNYDIQDHAVSLVRFSPIHRLNNRSSRVISLRPERSLSHGFPSLELDTVLEERSDVEQTQTEIFNSDSPVESTSQHNSYSS
ncbi:uncharacterized protein LOC129948089 isoform X2 [Eupeodes corollae]|uniref:uncharacterized protein LOC129948089 isoform X2 n=1 Tax=Eupeodes corollae TaxID=290404 RepID=UPI00249137E5|nr:uncharacterized protein LOC129948089 isoform X2 [Eupeodes corollae]